MSVAVLEASLEVKKQLSPNRSTAKKRYPLPALPPLPWEWGHKVAHDEFTGEAIMAQLTLLDILYPTGEEIFVAEGWFHRWLSVMLELMLRAHLGRQGWVVLGNVYVHWGRPGVPPLAPDLVAIPEGRYPTAEEGSFYVGDHGTLPQFVVEVVSPHFIANDIERKPLDYAALGVPEYLLIDMWSNPKAPMQLTGYRLGQGPFYARIRPDAEGGLTFQTVGLRFVGIGRETVKVYDIATGHELATPESWLALAQQEAAARVQAEARQAQAEAQARAEAAARLQAEAKLREAEEKLRKAGLL